MKKIDRNLMDCITSTFSKKFLNNLARQTKFIQRESTLTAESFISLCAFSEDSLYETSLSKLSSVLSAEDGIKISPQGLNERFNKYAVEFLKNVMKELLIKQNKILNKNRLGLQNLFNRINVTDSTSFKISDNLKEAYKGSGGQSVNAAVKILLQYDILSGQFLTCDVDKAATSESSYLPKLQQHIDPKDLVLKDLGYFKMDDLKFIDKRQAYYISKIKKYTVVYINEGKKYSQVDILEKVKDLAPGQILDIPDAYIGANKKLKTRLIITKLYEENKRKREMKSKEDSKRHKSRMDDDRLDLWNSVNIYVTNINKNILTADQIHDLYTLRWQVEIMFKIWKSIFKIDKVKKVNLYRFECYLYGKLISILINSIIVFKSKEIIYTSHGKYISEFKAFAIAKAHTCKVKDSLFKSPSAFSRAVSKMVSLIFEYAIKSKKKCRKSTFEILKSIKTPASTVEKVEI